MRFGQEGFRDRRWLFGRWSYLWLPNARSERLALDEGEQSDNRGDNRNAKRCNSDHGLRFRNSSFEIHRAEA